MDFVQNTPFRGLSIFSPIVYFLCVSLVFRRCAARQRVGRQSNESAGEAEHVQPAAAAHRRGLRPAVEAVSASAHEHVAATDVRGGLLSADSVESGGAGHAAIPADEAVAQLQ